MAEYKFRLEDFEFALLILEGIRMEEREVYLRAGMREADGWAIRYRGVVPDCYTLVRLVQSIWSWGEQYRDQIEVNGRWTDFVACLKGLCEAANIKLPKSMT